MKNLFVIIFLFFVVFNCEAFERSLSIGSPTLDSSVIFQVNSTTKGAIPGPVMTTTQRGNIASPVEGSFVFDSDLNVPFIHNGTSFLEFLFPGTTAILTNKTIDGDDNTVQDLALSTHKTSGNFNVFLQRDGGGAVIDSAKAIPTGDVVGTSDPQPLTNKTIAGGSNTITGLLHGTQVDNPTAAHGVSTVAGLSEAQTFSNKTYSDSIIFLNIATPSNPTSGSIKVYSKTEKLHFLDSAGTETELGVAGASPTFSVTDVDVGSYSVLSSDNTLAVDASTDTVTLNFPAAATVVGKIYWIYVRVFNARITLDPNGSETIKLGQQTFTTLDLYAVGSTILIQSDGSNWLVLDRHSEWRVDANLGGTSPNLGTGTVEPYATINAQLDLVDNGSSTNVGIACSGTEVGGLGGLECGGANLESMGIVIKFQGIIRICASFNHFAGGNAAGNVSTVFQMVQTPNGSSITIDAEGNERINTAPDGSASDAINVAMGLKICGVFTVDTANGNSTFRVFYEQTTGITVAVNIIRADRSGALGQRDIHFGVWPLN